MRRKTGEIDFDEITLDTYSSGDLSVKEKPIDNIVFVASTLVSILVVLIALFRVGFLAVLKNDFYSGRSDANMNKIIIHPAPRGIIVDRYGKQVVSNTSILNVYVRPAELIKRNELGKVLEANDYLGFSNEDFMNLLRKANSEDEDTFLLKKDIGSNEAIHIQSLGLESLVVQNDFKRDFKPAFSHVVGYVSLATSKDINEKNLTIYDSVGKNGLEFVYDDLLRGLNGKSVIFKNVKGESLDKKTLSEPVIGNEVKTTIDADLQEFFYERMRQGIMSLGQSGSGGVGIALDPRNGQVLALVSLPGFSPDELKKALIDPKKPMFNRAIAGLYSPGSTIKPIVATAAIKEKILRPTDEIYSSGVLEIPNPYYPDQPSRFVDWKAHGWVDMYSALARSCNIYFYAVTGGLPYNDHLAKTYKFLKGMGIMKLKEYLSLFGLASKTGINLPGEEKGFIPDSEEKPKRVDEPWRLGDTYISAIGQGDVVVTPIGLISAIASIVNGGKLYQPTLVPEEPKVNKDFTYLAPELAEVVKGLKDGVDMSYGTSHSLSNLPLPIAAKTGSAQIMNNAKTNAFFVGCGPVPWTESDPPICVLVLVENAKTGGLNAVPVGYDIFKWYYENRIKSR